MRAAFLGNESSGMRHHWSGTSTSASTASAAVESAVDAHASRILRMKSPPQACIDPSLGPYVTSIIRCSLADSSIPVLREDDPSSVFDMELVENEIDEFESLVELLQEHCSMSEEVARSALRSIAFSVRTGVIDMFDDSPVGRTSRHDSVGSIDCPMNFGGGSFRGGLGRAYRSKSVGAEHEYHDVDAINLLGEMLKDSEIGAQRGGLENGVDDIHDGDSPSSCGSLCGKSEKLSFVLDENGMLHRTGVLSKLEDAVGFSSATPPQCAFNVKHDTSSVSALWNSTNDGHNGLDSVSDENYAGTNGSDLPLTPLKPDRLIPVDLLGALDDPSTPQSSKPPVKLAQDVAESRNIDPLPSDVAASKSKRKGSSGKSRKKTKAQAPDLAAALFRPSRARSNSNVSDSKSPMLRSVSGPSSGLHGASETSPNSVKLGMSTLLQQQLESTTQILLSMNHDICQEAAAEAALMSNADVNVAQYIVDSAITAPPVCRHMLNNACYRSDCQFSHDVEGHTCVFWLRGRCGKGENCRFLHGFSNKVVEGKTDVLGDDDWIEKTDVGVASGYDAPTIFPYNLQSLPIKTTNLVQHNMRAAVSGRPQGNDPFPVLSSSFDMKTSSFGRMSWTYSSNNQDNCPSSSFFFNSGRYETDSDRNSPRASSNEQKTSPTSFASIASKGASQNGVAGRNGEEIGQSVQISRSNSYGRPKFAKIPQDLWTPSENRDSSVFYIPDPVERYKEVCASQSRKDVIDLHFQSTKTFPVVLATVLPDMLRDNSEVWVVTGTGHHVGRNTHQKDGGVLENAVVSWLNEKGYDCLRGKDANGYGGAVLIMRR